MALNLRSRNFLTLLDFKPEEIRLMLDVAHEYKRLKRAGIPHKIHEGKQVALLFEKTSTRTRTAFTVAARDLGIHPEFLGKDDIQMGKKESIEDTARVLGRMYDGIEYRGFSQELVQTLGEYAGVPVWNGLTNEFHPTQMLADLLTIEENFGHLKGLNFVYMGDTRNNLGNSLLVACAKMGLNFTACGPADLKPTPELIAAAEAIAKETGSVIRFTEDVKEACTDADVIYTDIWVSMGEPDEIWEKRINELKKFQVNKEAMSYAKETAIFLHCLPSFHDLKTTIGAEINDKFGLPEMEVTDEVFESPQSKVFDQAENRMHTIKAVMYATLK